MLHVKDFKSASTYDFKVINTKIKSRLFNHQTYTHAHSATGNKRTDASSFRNSACVFVLKLPLLFTAEFL